MRGAEKKTGTALTALECLEALALEKGLDSLSMRDVAKRVGIKLASLQYHFPTKADLIGAFVEYKIRECEEDINALLAAGGPGAVEKAIRHTIDGTFAATEPSLYAMIEARAEYDEASARAIERYMKCYLGRLRAIIVANNPSLSKKEALLKATVIASLLEGLSSTQGPARALGLGRARLSEAVFEAAMRTLDA